MMIPTKYFNYEPVCFGYVMFASGREYYLNIVYICMRFVVISKQTCRLLAFVDGSTS